MQKPTASGLALLSCYLLIGMTAFLYYPKWQNNFTEATISWDVSGYYFYLPAVFIYKDLKQVSFKDKIHKQYNPASGPYQAFPHRSGNYVMKYSAGLAVQYLPFFLAAHALAEPLGYSADGFSRPYQFAISLGSILVAFLGLWVLRRVLLQYFSDGVAAGTLLTVVFATNYLNYSAIDGAMTHNWLFTIYALLLWHSIRFHKAPSAGKAVGIGLLVGLAALTRPTEIIACLIPLLWGVGKLNEAKARWAFFTRKPGIFYLAIAAAATAAVGSIQLVYWKYVGGEWIIYSYEDQGFSWLSPHFREGLFSYRAGWLVYSPAMGLALLGFLPLFFRQRALFWSSFLFSGLFMYITFAWDIWWYGGSLGQRAMVQAYPVLALPLAAFLSLAQGRQWLAGLLILLLGFFAYYNLWITHQAHRGGLYVSEQMNGPYFRAIFLHNEVPEETKKLLDAYELFTGEPRNETLLLETGFEQDTLAASCPLPPVEGQGAACLTAEQQFSETVRVAFSQRDKHWVRAAATFRCQQKEWNIWQMAQLQLRFRKGETVVKERIMRVYRFLADGATRRLHLDVSLPEADFDTLEVQLWNAESAKPIVMDNLKITAFEE